MTASIWAPNGFSPEIVPFQTFEYTATGGQTNFSIAPFTTLYDNQLKVFKGITSTSGEILRNNQFEVIGTDVVLNSAASAGDYVRIDVYSENPEGTVDPLPPQTGEDGKYLRTIADSTLWDIVRAVDVDLTPIPGVASTDVQGALTEIAIYTPAGVGAIARGYQTVLRERPVSITDYGGVADSGITDNMPALIKALTVSPNVYFPPASGSYYFKSNATHTLSRDIQIDWNGQTIVHQNSRLTLKGATVATGRTLGANAARYASALQLNSVVGILPEDLVYIETTQIPSSDWSDTKKDCVKVRSLSGSVVNLRDRINFSYNTADTGLAITIYRPYRVTFKNRPLHFLLAAEGDTTPYVMVQFEGVHFVKLESPTILGQPDINRTTNIYRVGYQFYRCYGGVIDSPNYENMSYPIGIYGGTRYIFENNVTSRYNHHSHADCGDWSSDYYLDGLISTDSYQALNTHVCFRAHAKNIEVLNDYGLSTWRCCGGSIQNGLIQSSVDDTAELPQYQNTTPNTGYEYINADANFSIDNVTYDMPGRVNKSPFGVRYGNDIYITAVIASSIVVGFNRDEVTGTCVIGPGCEFGTTKSPYPDNAWINSSKWRTDVGSSGAYVPVRTFDPLGNMVTITPIRAQWTRIGDMVIVNGVTSIKILGTATVGQQVSWFESFPITTILGTFSDTCIGQWSVQTKANEPVQIGHVANNSVDSLAWFVTTLTATVIRDTTQTVRYSYMYFLRRYATGPQ